MSGCVTDALCLCPANHPCARCPRMRTLSNTVRIILVVCRSSSKRLVVSSTVRIYSPCGGVVVQHCTAIQVNAGRPSHVACAFLHKMSDWRRGEGKVQRPAGARAELRQHQPLRSRGVSGHPRPNAIEHIPNRRVVMLNRALTAHRLYRLYQRGILMSLVMAGHHHIKFNSENQYIVDRRFSIITTPKILRGTRGSGPSRRSRSLPRLIKGADSARGVSLVTAPEFGARPRPMNPTNRDPRPAPRRQCHSRPV